ncbi:DgyrCDS10519 [Dimorphilus gyrociliatus]|uniref:DgyrCDS10519 n=1 Tax=Dimorphilus gyrociliatus TaxID=2664684 RepID=A0A7I8W1K9_9ANNE|nr:DgyrCDS10519 [Dimorphilus gyrociliatus]
MESSKQQDDNPKSDSDGEKPSANGHLNERSPPSERHKKPCLVQKSSFDCGSQELVPALKTDKKCNELEELSSEQTHRVTAAVNNSSTRRGITIVMANTHFYIDLDDIEKYPDTMLAKMFGVSYSQNLTRPNERGEFNIDYDISPMACRAVLSFYKTGCVYIPPGVSVHEVRDVADFLLIPFNVETVRSRNLRDLLHEFSDEGARKQFEQFVDDELVTQMVLSAERGDRECHVVILTGEEIIDWDEDYPPQMGEEYTQVIKSAPMYRFFKYVENRDVAKSVLKDRRLKKVRLGIEGYPTYKEKVKRRPDGKYDVVYNYVQRPFIHMSWEKEEARSRHVDFQCVKSKSITNLADAVAEPEIYQQPAVAAPPQPSEPYPGNLLMAAGGEIVNEPEADING